MGKIIKRKSNMTEEKQETTTNSMNINDGAVNKESFRHSMSRRKSSFFNSRRLSFFRSHGTRGANVEILRGNTGSAFEGYARVARCGDYMDCCGFKFGTM